MNARNVFLILALGIASNLAADEPPVVTMRTPSGSLQPETLAVGGPLPGLVADFVSGPGNGHCGCPTIMIRNGKSRAVVIWSESLDPVSEHVARALDPVVASARQENSRAILGFWVVFDHDPERALSKQPLQGLRGSVARASYHSLRAKYNLTSEVRTVFLVEAEEIKAVWSLAPADVTPERIQELQRQATEFLAPRPPESKSQSH